ncbi:hypothetical protein S83_044081 [Arachis hypogaea]
MDRLVIFVYHHMGSLQRSGKDNMTYKESLVIEIHRVDVETCNLFFVESLFIYLGYSRYTTVYWLEPDLDLAKDLRVFRTDAEVMRICERAMKNDNTVHLYFDYPINVNSDIIDEDMVSDGSSESVYKINPPANNVHEDEVTNKVVGEINDKENEDAVEVNMVNEL